MVGTVTGVRLAEGLPNYSGGPVPESHRLSYSSQRGLSPAMITGKRNPIGTPHAILFPLARLGHGQRKVNASALRNTSYKIKLALSGSPTDFVSPTVHRAGPPGAARSTELRHTPGP